MTTIYVLNQGEYSDKHIVALYSTKKLAEEAQKLCPDSYIDDYKLDSKEIPEHPPGHTAWCVRIDLTTNIIDESWEVDAIESEFSPGIEHLIFYCANEGALSISCWARDQEHAEKIALDKYYQWKYENLPN